MGFLATALKLAPLVIQAGQELVPFVEWALGVEKAGATDADWASLHAKEAALRGTS
jgi:hypothetical protein